MGGRNERLAQGFWKRRSSLLLLLPAAALAFAGMGRLVRVPYGSPGEDGAAADAARALVGQRLDQLRRRWEQSNDQEAYATAQRFVRASLLPPGAVASFPASLSAGGSIQSIQVTRLRPHRYRIRATVQWRDTQGRLQHRRFETDLQHGPADDRWYLVDTEFLDMPR
jgi:hypothetical protein